MPKGLYEKEIAISLRLNDDINYCLPAKIDIKRKTNFLPRSKNGKTMISWDWNSEDHRGAYGYPHPVDSHIYRKEWLIKMLENAQFDNPCSMEIWMNNHRDHNYPDLSCFKEQKLISICANELGQGANNSTQGISVKELNHRWLGGERIKYDIRGRSFPQCHIYYDYQFERDK